MSWKQRRTSDARRTSAPADPAARDTIDGELVLSASEIASYEFCPEAWHLQRRGVARNFGGALNLQQGSRAHRDIGSRVDRVRGLERMRRVVLLVVAALLAGLLFQLLTASGLLRP